MDSFGGILVTFREQIRLDDFQILNRRRVVVDNDVIDALQRREIHGAQILGHERAEVRFVDMRVGRQARDENVGVVLRIHQVPDVTRMHQIEGAVTHDHLPDARMRSDGFPQLLAGFDLAAKIVLRRRDAHVVFPSRNANQFFVAPAIDAASQTGASRQ